MTLAEQIQEKRARDIRLGRVVVKPVKKDLENHVALPVADQTPRSSTAVVIPITVSTETAEPGIISAERLVEIENIARGIWAELRAAKRAAAAVKLPPPPVVAIKTIIKVTADYYKICVADIVSPLRHLRFVNPRHVAMFLAKELTLASYPSIAKHFGDRDHTTVMNGVKRIVGKRQVSPVLDQQIKDISALLTGADA